MVCHSQWTRAIWSTIEGNSPAAVLISPAWREKHEASVEAKVQLQSPQATCSACPDAKLNQARRSVIIVLLDQLGNAESGGDYYVRMSMKVGKTKLTATA